MELQFKNVTKAYGDVHAVDHVTHSMEKGVYGLLGVNGAGKTTLMRMLCTAINPTSGEILWNGKDIFSLGASYRGILGYLLHDVYCIHQRTPSHRGKEKGFKTARAGRDG